LYSGCSPDENVHELPVVEPNPAAARASGHAAVAVEILHPTPCRDGPATRAIHVSALVSQDARLTDRIISTANSPSSPRACAAGPDENSSPRRNQTVKVRDYRPLVVDRECRRPRFAVHLGLGAPTSNTRRPGRALRADAQDLPSRPFFLGGASDGRRPCSSGLKGRPRTTPGSSPMRRQLGSRLSSATSSTDPRGRRRRGWRRYWKLPDLSQCADGYHIGTDAVNVASLRASQLIAEPRPGGPNAPTSCVGDDPSGESRT